MTVTTTEKATGPGTERWDDARLDEVRVGDRVRVRSRDEILATLDDRGRLDNLPFMPEMLACAGRVFEVDAVVNRTCDTIKTAGTSGTTRGMDRTVHLRGSRCDGSAHGGCQARCLLYWKLEWLEPAPPGDGPAEVAVELRTGGGAPGEEPMAAADVPAGLAAATRGPGDTGHHPAWACQATELLGATRFVSARDPGVWVDDVRSGNASPRAAATGAAVIAFNKWQGFSRRLPGPLRIKGGRPWPWVVPTGERIKQPPLDLRPGELVEVRPLHEIERTLNERGELRGLRFAAEMVPYCGTRARVLARVDRIIDEKSGRMLSLRDCIVLDHVWCTGEYRALCRRKIYAYWREAWLRRVDDNSPVAPGPAEGATGRARRMLRAWHRLRAVAGPSRQVDGAGGHGYPRSDPAGGTGG